MRQRFIGCKGSSLVEEDRATVPTPQPVINRDLGKAPGVVDLPTWNPPSGSLALNRFLRNPEIGGDLFSGQNIRYHHLLHPDTSMKSSVIEVSYAQSSRIAA